MAPTVITWGVFVPPPTGAYPAPGEYLQASSCELPADATTVTLAPPAATGMYSFLTASSTYCDNGTLRLIFTTAGVVILPGAAVSHSRALRRLPCVSTQPSPAARTE